MNGRDFAVSSSRPVSASARGLAYRMRPAAVTRMPSLTFSTTLRYLASDSASAFSFALRREMSRMNELNVWRSPLLTGQIDSSAWNSSPLRRSASASTRRLKICAVPSRRKRSMPSWWCARKAGGTISSVSARPIASARLQPNMRSAAVFQSMMLLRSSMVTTASLAPAIRACSRCMASFRLRSASVRRLISSRSCAVVSNCHDTSRAMCVMHTAPPAPGAAKACSRSRAVRPGRSPCAGNTTRYSSV